MSDAELAVGDCLEVLPGVAEGSVRLAYLDPPFFTQKVHRLSPRDRSRQFAFDDLWSDHQQYAEFLGLRLEAVRRVLSGDGSLVFHCDRRSSHIARGLLDRVFGAERFRSEVIWQYRRWSNASRALLPSHQTLYVYSKGSDHVFNPIHVEYSPATNVDQLLQRRTRDESGKSVYDRDASGAVVLGKAKRGVPLGDVWDIPYLNPKARERVGYPTQKPLLLLERIVKLFSHSGDTVLDPFCGSGTTLVAARLLGRQALGIDVSPEAIALSERRLGDPVKTESRLMQKGRDAYFKVGREVLRALGDLDAVPVQRNRGMDALVPEGPDGGSVAVRAQRPDESLEEALSLLLRAGRSRGCTLMALVVTGPTSAPPTGGYPDDVVVIESNSAQLARLVSARSAVASAGSAKRKR